MSLTNSRELRKIKSELASAKTKLKKLQDLSQLQMKAWEKRWENYKFLGSKLSEIKSSPPNVEGEKSELKYKETQITETILAYEKIHSDHSFYDEIKTLIGDLSISNFLQNKENLEKVRSIYKSHCIDKNEFSLMLKSQFNKDYYILHSGDLCWDEQLISYIPTGEDKKIIYQVSHHGSYKENKLILDKIEKEELRFDHALFSFGYKNVYRHPDFQTIVPFYLSKTKIHYITCFKHSNKDIEINQRMTKIEY